MVQPISNFNTFNKLRRIKSLVIFTILRINNFIDLLRIANIEEIFYIAELILDAIIL